MNELSKIAEIAIPLWAVFGYMLFMCAVQALPRPGQNAAPFYVWVYQFAHLLCLNLALVIDPMKKFKTETTTDTVTVTRETTAPTDSPKP
jgi:hypothetical protein